MGNSSGDDSPDWLRSFQTPTKSGFTLPSSSELSLSDSDQDNGKEIDLDEADDDDDDLPLQERYASAEKKPPVRSTLDKKRKRENKSPTTGKKGVRRTSKQKTSKKSTKTDEPGNSVWMLLSDSESCPEASPVREHNDIHLKELSGQETSQYSDKKEGNVTILEETLKESSKQKSPIKKKTEDQLSTKKKLDDDDHVKGENYDDMDVPEEVISAKPAGPYASSSILPLVLPEKVQRSKALVECEDESIDLSGDVGAVGRVVITDNQDMLLDLKGTIYKTTIVPSRTFCVVRNSFVEPTTFNLSPFLSVYMYVCYTISIFSYCFSKFSFVQVSFGQSEAKVCFFTCLLVTNSSFLLPNFDTSHP
ncbi:hypothetical protein AgCh_005749 [Apium graveolens]